MPLILSAEETGKKSSIIFIYRDERRGSGGGGGGVFNISGHYVKNLGLSGQPNLLMSYEPTSSMYIYTVLDPGLMPIFYERIDLYYKMNFPQFQDGMYVLHWTHDRTGLLDSIPVWMGLEEERQAVEQQRLRRFFLLESLWCDCETEQVLSNSDDCYSCLNCRHACCQDILSVQNEKSDTLVYRCREHGRSRVRLTLNMEYRSQLCRFHPSKKIDMELYKVAISNGRLLLPKEKNDDQYLYYIGQ